MDSISALNYVGILKQGSKDDISRWVLLKLLPPLFAVQEAVRLSSPVENKSSAKEDDFLVGEAKGLSGKLCFVLQPSYNARSIIMQEKTKEKSNSCRIRMWHSPWLDVTIFIDINISKRFLLIFLQ